MLTTTQTNNLFSPINNALIRLTTEGVAVKTNNGYKVYNHKNGTVTNCSDFVIDAGVNLFFYAPCNKVEVGDIVLTGNSLVTIVSVNEETHRIEAFKYEDSSVITLVPEKFMFMGEGYLFTKVVSVLGDIKEGINTKKVMNLMLIGNMFKNEGNNNFLNQMMMFNMMNKCNFGDIFSGLFDFGEDEDKSK